ncbi:hypothetical protein Lesp02_21680 [Lentzea sp. NBRC 105346]|uniref:hypothetical protein n=1 Tax=Lentzea sp. NBRC 105346 TaxID=3032205 RepID=UPI0024A5F2FD|nr:hypothetical protein [Lentzea sp. NBRC 105346]GLZ29978.1 hypothetical protein Lesp02_21680 [Lentzea sp. NBRC 105346]
MDLDSVANELYGLTPKDFTAVRNQRAREAKDKDLAKAITDLRKPTVGAWAVNLLARDNPKELVEALGLSQAGLDMRELGKRRKQLLETLTYRTLELTGPLADAALEQVRSTLGAAMAEPELADQVRAGRLTKGLEYSGFGAAEVFAAPAPPAGEDALARKRRERQERKIAEATAAVEEAEEALREAKLGESAAKRAHDRALEQLEEAKRQVKTAAKAHATATRKLAELTD